MVKIELDSVRDHQYNKRLTIWAENDVELGVKIDGPDEYDEWIAIPIEALMVAIEAVRLDFQIYDKISNEQLNIHNGK